MEFVRHLKPWLQYISSVFIANFPIGAREESNTENLGITFGTFEENIEEILKDFGWDR